MNNLRGRRQKEKAFLLMRTFILKNLEDFYYEVILSWRYCCMLNK